MFAAAFALVCNAVQSPATHNRPACNISNDWINAIPTPVGQHDEDENNRIDAAVPLGWVWSFKLTFNGDNRGALNQQQKNAADEKPHACELQREQTSHRSSDCCPIQSVRFLFQPMI